MAEQGSFVQGSSEQGSFEQSEVVLDVCGLGKTYLIYDRPFDRLRQMLSRGKKSFFTEFAALSDVSFQLRRGEALGVLGQNGAGKSTLLQIIAGTLTPTHGEVRRVGRVSALLELGSGFNPEFTGRENVFLNGAVLGVPEEEMKARFDDIAAFADIGDFLDRPVKTYSSGMFVRLAFAVATAVDPDILIVDEALSVGDVVFQQRCATRIRQMREDGTSLLFVSHDIEGVKRLCDQAVVLEKGRLIKSGDAPMVGHWYLGRVIGDRMQEAPDAASAAAMAGGGGDGDGDGDGGEGADGEDAQHAAPAASADKDFPWLRHGDGKAEIVRSQVVGADGKVGRMFELDETVTFRFDVRYDIDLETCGLGFYLRDRLGTDVVGVNTWQEYVDVGPVRVGEFVRYEFKLKLSVRPGAYGVSPAAAYNQEDLRFLDWVHNAVVIEIVDPVPKHMVFGIYSPKVETVVRTLTADEVSTQGKKERRLNSPG